MTTPTTRRRRAGWTPSPLGAVRAALTAEAAWYTAAGDLPAVALATLTWILIRAEDTPTDGAS